MENSAEALKIAFAIFVFVLAISISFVVLAQAKSTSDTVMYYSDKTNFQQVYNSENTNVGVDKVISTIYRYADESLAVTIKDHHENIIAIFDTDIEKNCPWMGSKDLIKKRIQAFITGEIPAELSSNTFIVNNPGIGYSFKYEKNDNYEQDPTTHKYYIKSKNGNYPIATESLKELINSKWNTAKFSEIIVETNNSGIYKSPSDYTLNNKTLTDDGTTIQITPGGKKVYITYKL
jgi:hypothetical protein